MIIHKVVRSLFLFFLLVLLLLPKNHLNLFLTILTNLTNQKKTKNIDQLVTFANTKKVNLLAFGKIFVNVTDPRMFGVTFSEISFN